MSHEIDFCWSADHGYRCLSPIPQNILLGRKVAQFDQKGDLYWLTQVKSWFTIGCLIITDLCMYVSATSERSYH